VLEVSDKVKNLESILSFGSNILKDLKDSTDRLAAIEDQRRELEKALVEANLYFSKAVERYDLFVNTGKKKAPVVEFDLDTFCVSSWRSKIFLNLDRENLLNDPKVEGLLLYEYIDVPENHASNCAALVAFEELFIKHFSNYRYTSFFKKYVKEKFESI
jgi:hypothetical protein